MLGQKYNDKVVGFNGLEIQLDFEIYFSKIVKLPEFQRLSMFFHLWVCTVKIHSCNETFLIHLCDEERLDKSNYSF